MLEEGGGRRREMEVEEGKVEEGGRRWREEDEGR